MTVPTVSPGEMFELVKGDSPPDLIDVRTPTEYAAVHIEGSRSVPLDQLDPWAEFSECPAQAHAPVYLLCLSGSRAAQAARRFAGAGIENVFIIQGGIVAWERAGLPVVRGSKQVISLERQVRIAAGLLVLLGVVLG